MKVFRKKYHPPGTAPGTLTEVPAYHPDAKPVRIDMVAYTSTQIDFHKNIGVDDCRLHLNNEATNWIHVRGALSPEILRELGKQFDLHPLALEDVNNHGQRPKVEVYDKQLFVIANMPVIVDDEIHIEQVSIFCGKGYVLSFHEQLNDDTYDILYKRLQNNNNQLRRSGSDGLLYVLLDLIVDTGFPTLEKLGDRLEVIEESLMNADSRHSSHAIHHIKRELILLRRALWPQREMINTLLREENNFFHKENLVYLRDCYDHTIQIMELIESYRDIAASTLDVYLSTVSYRLNEIMRFLTIISTIFIPPTFIVGVYGMNFRPEAGSWNMPELLWPYGYLMVWVVMVLMTVGMLGFFKHKRWL